MPPPEETPPSIRQGNTHGSRIFRWLARALFAAAVLAALYGVWLRRHRPSPPVAAFQTSPAAAVDLSREALQPWTSAEDGVSVRHPARFDAVRGFGEYTSRDLQDGLRETDLVAFRCGTPRSVVTIHLYRALRPLSWDQWKTLAKADTGPIRFPGEAREMFAARFGGPNRTFSDLRQGDRPALACADAVAEGSSSRDLEMWMIESRLVAEGDRAARITAGAPAKEWMQIRRLLRQALDSFRWNPPR